MPDVTSAQEAAVDARAVAIEAIARAIAADVDEANDWESYRWAGVDALDALLSPSKKPCAQPLCFNGVLMHPDATTEPIPMGPCPDCTDGFVLSPPPIEGLLEQVGWMDPEAPEDFVELEGFPHGVTSVGGFDVVPWVAVFRLPSHYEPERG